MRTPRNQSGPTTTPALGSVSASEIMPAREYCRRMGHGKKAWDALRHRGFPTIRCGKQVFVEGAAALKWFRGLGEQQSGNRNEDAASCDSVVCEQQKTTGESITVLITLRRDERPSRRRVMSTLENRTLIDSPVLNQTYVFFGDSKVRFNQTYSNARDVNNAVAEKGTAIQTTGNGNVVHVQKPKGSHSVHSGRLLRSSGTGAFESHSAADGHDNLYGGDQVR